MTCIVGLVDGEKVWIGADSAGCSGCLLTPRASEVAKLGQRGEMLIGYTGEVRPGQIALHALEIPEHPDGLSTIDYLIRLFVPAFMAALEAGGFPATWHKPGDGPGWTLVVGYRGTLAGIDEDFQVNISGRGYDAYGCGREFALGSLHTTEVMTQEEHWKPHERAVAALMAAAEMDVYVSEPFVVESVG